MPLPLAHGLLGASIDRSLRSVARFAGSIRQRRRAPRVTLTTLAHPGLLSAAAPRLIDADIRVGDLLNAFDLTKLAHV